ncbi:LacI family transcriptional regulator [Bifidobacterium ramosum]|uniref:LacI family DNA-binding transcriptional regulator n=1 Tax=Bifidobacterium ramosum TaxID=1798158 RepID=A0A6L4WXY0_9BIFI|nr:LacI family DNA-binding transcriptional regulator [Bifidobacterium ramosum]KAB8286919.1 LacI family transcriptional regulator [Bifidobacterium ramosum]NEG72559.1 LacI family DNA-binding transcriptional regulator [Bifidobacterium ramosum]
MVGMRDVAKKAGVSLSTVSLVVNGTGYVSDDMRARVTEAMQSLNYIPNELARNLYRDRTNTIGVIVPTIRHPFFATFTAALQREFSARGLRTMLCSTADSDTGESEYIDMLQRHMMDGIVMAAHTAHPTDYWTSIGRPVVAFDRYLGTGIPSVGSDHEQGGRMLAELLIRTGARHVVMIGGPRSQFHDLAVGGADTVGAGVRDTTFPTVRYYLTLERELKAAGVRYDYVEAGEVGDFEGYAVAAHHVFDWFGGAGDGRGEDAVDAIVSSDLGASYAVQEAIRCGVRIPDDVQIVAYDGTYLAGTAGVRLTAVRQDFEGLAAAVAARMTGLIAGGAGGAAGAVGAGDADRDAAGSTGAGASAGSADGSSGAAGAGTADLLPLTLRIGDSTR